MSDLDSPSTPLVRAFTPQNFGTPLLAWQKLTGAEHFRGRVDYVEERRRSLVFVLRDADERVWFRLFLGGRFSDLALVPIYDAFFPRDPDNLAEHYRDAARLPEIAGQSVRAWITEKRPKHRPELVYLVHRMEPA